MTRSKIILMISIGVGIVILIFGALLGYQNSKLSMGAINIKAVPEASGVKGDVSASKIRKLIPRLLTYSDNLLKNGDFSYQTIGYSDELLMWFPLNENEWCDRFTKETGYMDIDCNVYDPAIGKTFPTPYTAFGWKEEWGFDDDSPIWWPVRSNSKYLLKYRFKNCISKVAILGWSDPGQWREIAVGDEDVCVNNWSDRKINFTIPSDISKIAIMFKHDTIQGYLDDVEFLQVVMGCYDSDSNQGKSDIYKKGYIKIRNKKIEDSCQDDQYLTERQCKWRYRASSRSVECPNGCYNGVCLKHEYEFKHPNSYITQGDIAAINYLKDHDSRRGNAYNTLFQDSIPELMELNPSPPGAVWLGDDDDDYPYKVGMKDCSAVQNLATAYLLTNDVSYADKALEFINAWANDAPQPQDMDGELRASSRLFAMLWAADYLYDYPGWQASDKQKFTAWIEGLVGNYRHWASLNNHDSWRVLFLISAAQFLEDPELFDYAVERWKWDIEKQLDSNGMFFFEHDREELGPWYHFFSQTPLTLAAEIARHNGIDLYDYDVNGKSLKLAMDWFAPYIIRDIVWPYYSLPPQPHTTIPPQPWSWNVYVHSYEVFYNLYQDDLYWEVLEAELGQHETYSGEMNWYPLPGTTLINGYSDICHDKDGDGYYTNTLCGSIDKDDNDFWVGGRRVLIPTEITPITIPLITLPAIKFR